MRHSEWSSPQEDFSIISPARFPDRNREPGRIGFMSTQKRENRWQRQACTKRAGVWGHPLPAHSARNTRAMASGETAPLLSLFWVIWAWFHPIDEDLSLGAPERSATNFLRSDQPTRQLVQPDLEANRRGSPPFGTGSHAAFGTPASLRSSCPPIPFPSGLAPLPLPLPQAPVGYHHRAERYDGKRDMYFLHAA